MEKIPKLIIELCYDVNTPEELAAKLHELNVIDVHKLKYIIIYNYFQNRLKETGRFMEATYDTAAYFNISESQIRRVRLYMKDRDIWIDKEIVDPPRHI